MVEVPPPPQKKRKSTGLEKRMTYKYPKARKFLADWEATHFTEEVQDLLTAGMELLVMIKIEAEHSVPGFDWFLAVLEE